MDAEGTTGSAAVPQGKEQGMLQIGRKVYHGAFASRPATVLRLDACQPPGAVRRLGAHRSGDPMRLSPCRGKDDQIVPAAAMCLVPQLEKELAATDSYAAAI